MNELKHFGIKKRSGRYPWGSGERPYQGEGPITGNKSPKRAIKQRKKDLKQRRTLTDEEIKQRIERMKLEKQFKEITEDLIKKENYMIISLDTEAFGKIQHLFLI